MPATSMSLKVLLPFRTFVEETGVRRIVAETRAGAMGLLPRRRDCIAVLPPGILIFESEARGEVYVAVDQGVLVKTGPEVRVSVRRAIMGTQLVQLRDAVEEAFLTLDEQERSAHLAMAKLESGFLRRFASFRDE